MRAEEPSCSDANRSLLAKRGEETARAGDVERQYGGRRGRTRDKMAASEKLAAEKQRPIDPLRARAHSCSDRIPRDFVRRVWTIANEIANATYTQMRDQFISVFEHRHER